MADDTENNSSKENENTNYVRKKNIISGVDNDHLIIGMLGLLGAAIAAPHIKSMIDNAMKQYQNQMPHNGAAQQQPVYLPPVQEQPEQQKIQQENNLLRDYEKRQQESKDYQALVEQENQGQSQAISMVPERERNPNPKNTPKKGGVFEAGSVISAG